MGNRRKPYKFKSYESAKTNGRDITSNITLSMLQSDSWHGLTKNAQVLYIYMKLQQYGQKNIDGYTEQYFYFNKGLYKEKYNLYKNDNQFYKDRNLLIKKGFIEIEQNGKYTRTKNIYKLSDKWKE